MAITALPRLALLAVMLAVAVNVFAETTLAPLMLPPLPEVEMLPAVTVPEIVA